MTPKETERMLKHYFEDNAKCVIQYSDFDEQVLEDAWQARKLTNENVKAGKGLAIWRLIMTNAVTKYAAVILAGFAIVSGILLIDRSASPAFAVEQTIEAMRKIRTIYFEAKFYKQGGPAKCWMKFEGSQEKPTHVCIYGIIKDIKVVDSPEANFVYNAEINRYMNKTRDERNANWYPNFTTFFAEALEEAARNPDVAVADEYDEELGRDVFVINVEYKDRAMRYAVDKETHLPLRYETVRMDDWRKYLRKTVAVESMSKIRYNEPIPEGVFTYPKDAVRVTNEHDVMLSAKDGMVVGDMTDEEACKVLIKEFVKAMNERNWERVTKLYFPFVAPPAEVLKQLNIPDDKPLIELKKMGKPEKRGDYWYIYTEAVEFTGREKKEEVPIKFYEINGVRYCRVMFPD